MTEWLQTHESALWWAGILSLITFLGTLIAIPVLVVRIPDDYFTRAERPPEHWSFRYPLVRPTVLILKNLLGAVFFLLGLSMLFLPGQGILTMLIGVTLMNFPGKRALERAIIRERPVHRAVNWLRARAHRAPLQLPARDSFRKADPSHDSETET
jgi:hypothetical protein